MAEAARWARTEETEMKVRKRVGHSRDAWDERKREYLAAVSARIGIDIALEGRRSSRRARAGASRIAITGSREVREGLWWLGLDESELDDPNLCGVVLLCESGARLLDFCLPA